MMVNGQILLFFAQLLYWLGIIVLLFYAVWQYKRWVNYQLGVGRSGKLRPDLAEEDDDAADPASASGWAAGGSAGGVADDDNDIAAAADAAEGSELEDVSVEQFVD